MGLNLIRARMLSMCWDSMEVRAKEIRSMGRESSFLVKNFPLSKVLDADKLKLARVMQFRAMEIKDARHEAHQSGTTNRVNDSLLLVFVHRHAWQSIISIPGVKAWLDLLQEVPHGLSWIVNEGILKPSVDVTDLQKRIQVRDVASIIMFSICQPYWQSNPDTPFLTNSGSHTPGTAAAAATAATTTVRARLKTSTRKVEPRRRRWRKTRRRQIVWGYRASISSLCDSYTKPKANSDLAHSWVHSSGQEKVQWAVWCTISC